MPTPVHLAPWFDLHIHITGLKLVSASLGPDNLLYILAEKQVLDFTLLTSTFRERTFVVLCCHEYGVDRIDIQPQPINFQYVQPLPNRQVLLVKARTDYHGADNFTANGYIYDMAGDLQHTILLGDGVEDVQTTRDGRIWVSFFDEGVLGGNKVHDAFGASGLVCLDAYGNKLYEYTPINGVESITDCYALNVANERDTWCYYYTGFPLVHLRDYRVTGTWQCPIHYAHKFILSGCFVLMQGNRWDADTLHLFSLQNNGQMQLDAKYHLCTEDGDPILANFVVMRDDTCILINQECCYRISMSEILATWPK